MNGTVAVNGAINIFGAPGRTGDSARPITCGLSEALGCLLTLARLSIWKRREKSARNERRSPSPGRRVGRPSMSAPLSRGIRLFSSPDYANRLIASAARTSNDELDRVRENPLPPQLPARASSPSGTSAPPCSGPLGGFRTGFGS
ncbi:hypothetical protein SKAU_G00188400 [Synaphobranchus kaupii]|uniref:Uncharacterized protein n=1 Tax=Synaphobranchus kaupii TaxID=118154 RepID=A0A9Q1FD85_SYNKA|nr:hypothetical protein SKAU_G00188400 [Synaphobranchus kaupii]